MKVIYLWSSSLKDRRHQDLYLFDYFLVHDENLMSSLDFSKLD